MRNVSGLAARASVLAGALLAVLPPAMAGERPATTILSAAASLPPGAPNRSQAHEIAVTMRAQWLARGHSVPELASLEPPTITGGTVLDSTITVGAAGQYPSLTLSYKADKPGLAYVEVAFVSPKGVQYFLAGYSTWNYTRTGTLNFASVEALGLWSIPGDWTLGGVEIVDNAGNTTTYTAAQMATLFTNTAFHVINTGMVDAENPRILGGSLGGPVSLSAKLPWLFSKIGAAVKSGPGLYRAYVQIQPPGATYSYYTVLPYAEPKTRADMKAYNIFGSYDATGTWTVLGAGVCDFAFNCTTINDDAGIVALFGTDTFTVTP